MSGLPLVGTGLALLEYRALGRRLVDGGVVDAVIELVELVKRQTMGY